ncbi:MAG: hypothetical protein IMY85_06340 [Chloroflexi bacterium]|nr:hypothetical protein [Chloroflexota bacterium]
MPSAEFDLGYLETAVELLESYLLSKESYWKLNASSPSGEPGYPTLTLGALLLAEARIQARRLTSSQNQQKLVLEKEINRIRMKWRTAWGNKAREEFRSRLDLWRNFLEEFRHDPQDNYDRYRYEVSRRVMLQLLEGEAIDIPISQQQMLSGLDRILKGLMVPGDFVWDEQLAPGFPPENYSYLHSALKG